MVESIGLLVVVKSILYEGTIALGTSMDSRKDLWRSERRGDSGGSGWRKEAVETWCRIHNITEKTPSEIFSRWHNVKDSASGVHEVTASRGRISVTKRLAVRRRSSRTAVDQWGVLEDRRVSHCRSRVVSKLAKRPEKASPAVGCCCIRYESVEVQRSRLTPSLLQIL